MRLALGDTYAEPWAQDQRLGELGGRTVMEALDDGVDPAVVWRAVWTMLRLPDRDR
jgi:hypothetical protein